MTLIIGLTGGIGSGKTAVSDHFGSLGITIVDADIASRVVVEKGKPALDAIAKKFGPDILTSAGELNRPLLREKIFANPDDKLWLEQLLHPLIGEEIRQQLENSSSPYTVFVSPLLLETEQHKLANRILLVDVAEELQLQRTMARDNNSQEQVKAIMASQASRHTRREMADDIVINDSTLEALHSKIEDLHQQYLTLAKN
ncbi:MAG: dephospho-CoA kinase [Candidatus Pelagadaptatus aseana]|uniref:dephospho-CoA kinase n=1 Tax=Candidatus Pelagadaptatus aseana TaxID=3120508 RepID=UPI0039B32327